MGYIDVHEAWLFLTFLVFHVHNKYFSLATSGYVTPPMGDTALEQMLGILRLPEGINLLEPPPISEDSAD